jgi:hypothetical protein
MYLYAFVHMQMLESICHEPIEKIILSWTINPFPSISSRQRELDESYTTVSYSKTNEQVIISP